MMKNLAVAAGALLFVAASFAAGAAWNRRGTAAAEDRAVEAYVCPMHPNIRSTHPGDCPSCGMRLVPVQEAGAAQARGVRADLAAGAVHVTAERQQAVGVKLAVVERRAGTRTLRTTGRVAADENSTYPIVAGTSGWIRSVGAATTGTQVRKNERLASFYAPEFAAAQQSWYSGLDTSDRVANQQVVAYNSSVVSEGVQRFADSLRNMGVSEQQLTEMATRRRLVQDVYLTSPVDGFVLQRSVSSGLRFDRGFEFYRIADLSRVWILADVYQHQLPFIRRGASARITTAQENQSRLATVSNAEPTFDEATLTLKVRLAGDNPGQTLKPGMFVDVELPIDLPESLVVPADAIVDSGLRKTVFVDRGDGYFEPRQVETGWRIGDEVEVTKGLMAGDRIVISGTFLIDSESRMKAAASGEGAVKATDPVCGMQVDEAKARVAKRTADHEGKTHFFCSDDCLRQFRESPARFMKEPAGR